MVAVIFMFMFATARAKSQVQKSKSISTGHPLADGVFRESARGKFPSRPRIELRVSGSVKRFAEISSDRNSIHSWGAESAQTSRAKTAAQGSERHFSAVR